MKFERKEGDEVRDALKDIKAVRKLLERPDNFKVNLASLVSARETCNIWRNRLGLPIVKRHETNNMYNEVLALAKYLEETKVALKAIRKPKMASKDDVPRPSIHASEFTKSFMDKLPGFEFLEEAPKFPHCFYLGKADVNVMNSFELNTDEDRQEVGGKIVANFIARMAISLLLPGSGRPSEMDDYAFAYPDQLIRSGCITEIQDERLIGGPVVYKNGYVWFTSDSNGVECIAVGFRKDSGTFKGATA